MVKNICNSYRLCFFYLFNFQSSVQLGLDFLSPESLAESMRLSEEIRGLPHDHDLKLQKLEVSNYSSLFSSQSPVCCIVTNEVVCWLIQVGKISLYAASSAIKEVQKLVLDPKYATYFIILAHNPHWPVITCNLRVTCIILAICVLVLLNYLDNNADSVQSSNMKIRI